MKNASKYTRGYFNPSCCKMKWTKKEYIDTPPIWCSVDLRDGNQSLIVPMSLEEKLEFFKLLVKLGFKEIEVGFPASSETEYEFVRTLIEKNMIPDDVTIQVLTQSRAHIIKRTFEALKDCKNAIVHLYNSTSQVQREQVFKKSKEEILDIAVFGAKLLKSYAKKEKGNIRFEYSPESFTGTEMDFALDVCNAVLDVFKPTSKNKVIINLPVTVSMSLPHIYANQVEFIGDNLKYRENVILSLHPHNDRGCAVADSELGLLAGAQRIEGTLFGNGERTGNVDIITMALNMYSHGVEPNLDFSNMPEIISVYEKLTDMHVYERQPYGGKLVFAAFSGSHQDAIAKSMKWRNKHSPKYWNVPYLPIDPKDIGRQYEGDIIRINSQSGKGGIGYLLKQRYGYNLPSKMLDIFGCTIKNISDFQHKELKPEEIFDIFKNNFINTNTPFKISDCHFIQKDGISAKATISKNGVSHIYEGKGNGRLDAVSDAFRKAFNMEFEIEYYSEHSLEQGSKSKAVAYVGVKYKKDKISWGAGTDEDIIKASIHALVTALNYCYDK